MAKLAKKELRIKIKALVSNMSSEEKRRQSDLIYKKLIEREELVRSERIGVYLSLSREVNTKAILDFCFRNSKQVFVPKYIQNSLQMDFFQLFSLQDYQQLPQTEWRIKQPPIEDHSRPEALSTGGLDLIIVPAVAFTADGHRLGNGFGYYDNYLQKYLTSCGKRPVLLGLAFTQQIVSSISTEEHDIGVDSVIFP